MRVLCASIAEREEYGLHFANVLSGECATAQAASESTTFFAYVQIYLAKACIFPRIHPVKPQKHQLFFLRFKRFGNFEKKFATSNSLKKAVYLRSERFSQISREHPIAHIRDFSYLCRRFLCVYTQLQQRKINLKQYNNGRIKSTSRTTREV